MISAPPEFEKIYRERREFFLRVLTRRVGNSHVAEEILQEAFLHVSQIDEPELIANPDGYLMKVAINLSTDWLRQDLSRRRREKSWVESRTILQASGEAAESEPAADRALIAKEEWSRLARAVETLSPTVRTAFILHKVKGLSHEETAAKMGLSKSTVEKHIMKAMRQVIEQGAVDGT